MMKINQGVISIRRFNGENCLKSIFLALLFFCFAAASSGQAPSKVGTGSAKVPTRFRIGEKLAYAVTFGKFDNAGYAETHVVSRGKIGGKDAIELRSKFKTYEFVSAAFLLLDESRVVYAAPDTGLPLYTIKTANDGPLPRESRADYLANPTTSFDLLSLIFKAREMGGVGTFPLFEDEQEYNVTFSPVEIKGENKKLLTQAGTFDTIVANVQSDFLASKGILDLKINFDTSDRHIPVLIRFRTVKGDFKAELASMQMTEYDAGPAPIAMATPKPTPTPQRTPLSQPYVENQPLAADLGFDIGESLDYNVTMAGRKLAVVNFNAKERKLVQRNDSLLLVASVTAAEEGNGKFSVGDYVKVQVNPDTLAPRSSDSKFGPGLSVLNQTLQFDDKTGVIKYGPANSIDCPIGTHSILSMIYAMRSFNLKPSKDASNPVNDTRVAVFWNDRAYVFTLRPSEPANISLNGVSTPAQLVTIKTGNEQLDSLKLKVWLSVDDRRVPLRYVVGNYQADLILPPPSLLPK